MEDTNAAPTRQLTGFQTLDRDKRALEHTIYDQELKSAQANIKKLEGQHQSKQLGEKTEAAKNEQPLAGADELSAQPGEGGFVTLCRQADDNCVGRLDSSLADGLEVHKAMCAEQHMMAKGQLAAAMLQAKQAAASTRVAMESTNEEALRRARVALDSSLARVTDAQLAWALADSVTTVDSDAARRSSKEIASTDLLRAKPDLKDVASRPLVCALFDSVRSQAIYVRDLS